MQLNPVILVHFRGKLTCTPGKRLQVESGITASSYQNVLLNSRRLTSCSCMCTGPSWTSQGHRALRYKNVFAEEKNENELRHKKLPITIDLLRGRNGEKYKHYFYGRGFIID